MVSTGDLMRDDHFDTPSGRASDETQEGQGSDMQWLNGQWAQAGEVAGKAALMYATALLALRIGERRTVAQWTIIDFAAAVAMGAIIGRTAVAGSQSYVTGAAAVVTLVLVHRLVSLLRFTRAGGRLLEHRIRVLACDGQLRSGELRKCAITPDDLYARLREQGIFDLRQVQYLLYEAKGGLTVVPRTPGVKGQDPPLVGAGIRESIGFRTTQNSTGHPPQP